MSYEEEKDKQTEHHWWGGLVGDSTDDGNCICVGYDDGVMKFHTKEELAQKYSTDRLKSRPAVSEGLIRDVPMFDHARAFCHIRLNSKRLPVGVLLGNGKDTVASKELYTAHILSIEMASEFNKIDCNVLGRRGRSRHVLHEPPSAISIRPSPTQLA